MRVRHALPARVSQVHTHVLVLNGLGAEGDGHDDDDRDGKEDDGEVQVVHTTDDRGAAAGLHAAPGAVNKLGDHTRHPNQKSYDQSPKGSLWKKTWGYQVLDTQNSCTLLRDGGKRVRETIAPGHLGPRTPGRLGGLCQALGGRHVGLVPVT